MSLRKIYNIEDRCNDYLKGYQYGKMQRHCRTRSVVSLCCLFLYGIKIGSFPGWDKIVFIGILYGHIVFHIKVGSFR